MEKSAKRYSCRQARDPSHFEGFAITYYTMAQAETKEAATYLKKVVGQILQPMLKGLVLDRPTDILQYLADD